MEERKITIDLMTFLYALLAIEVILVAMASVGGYVIIRTAIHKLKVLRVSRQAKKAYQGVMERPRLSTAASAT